MEGNSRNILMKTHRKYPLVNFKTEKIDKRFSSLCSPSSEGHCFISSFPGFSRSSCWQDQRVEEGECRDFEYKAESLQRNLSQCHLVHHKSHIGLMYIIHDNSVPTPHRTKSVTTTNTSWSLFRREIITVECENDTKHMSTSVGNITEFLNVAVEGKYDYHGVLNSYKTLFSSYVFKI